MSDTISAKDRLMIEDMNHLFENDETLKHHDVVKKDNKKPYEKGILIKKDVIDKIMQNDDMDMHNETSDEYNKKLIAYQKRRLKREKGLIYTGTGLADSLIGIGAMLSINYFDNLYATLFTGAVSVSSFIASLLISKNFSDGVNIQYEKYDAQENGTLPYENLATSYAEEYIGDSSLNYLNEIIFFEANPKKMYRRYMFIDAGETNKSILTLKYPDTEIESIDVSHPKDVRQSELINICDIPLYTKSDVLLRHITILEGIKALQDTANEKLRYEIQEEYRENYYYNEKAYNDTTYYQSILSQRERIDSEIKRLKVNDKKRMKDSEERRKNYEKRVLNQ